MVDSCRVACQTRPPAPLSGDSPSSAHHDRGSSESGATAGESTTVAGTDSPDDADSVRNTPIGSMMTGATAAVLARSSATTPRVYDFP
jgi:hypothetical protein